MQRIKKHARLFTERMGGVISFGHNDSFKIEFQDHSMQFIPEAAGRMMSCQCFSNNKLDFTFSASRNCVFDIIDRFARDHLRETLREYSPPDLLELGNYIEEENGETEVRRLRERVAAEPDLQYAELGGNCIFVEYVSGALIIRDELLRWATNMVEL